MQITHRALADASAPAATVAPLAQVVADALPGQVPRLSCCCRLSELLPLVRQAHDAARAAHLGEQEQPGVAA